MIKKYFTEKILVFLGGGGGIVHVLYKENSGNISSCQSYKIRRQRSCPTGFMPSPKPIVSYLVNVELLLLKSWRNPSAETKQKRDCPFQHVSLIPQYYEGPDHA